MPPRPPVPPFTLEGATHKVRMAEDAWNSRDPDRVVQVYTEDTRWRNRAEFPVGREQVRAFLQRKWARELDYRLIKELWACAGNRIAVRFAYEWHDDSGSWYRSYGNENWEFDEEGLMRWRGNSAGRSGGGRMSTPDSANSACRKSAAMPGGGAAAARGASHSAHPSRSLSFLIWTNT
jgi:nuclear transport factor 2 (NTF2) superfamily protein